MLCVRTLVCLAMLFLMTRITVGEDVILKNETDREVSVSYSYTFKNKTSLIEAKIAPGGTRSTTAFDRTLVIEDGKMAKYYAKTPLPRDYTYRVLSAGLFMTRMAHASLKKDGCIHLLPVEAENGSPDLPQPEGFPLCPYREADVSPPEPPPPAQPSLAEARDFAMQIEAWSCPPPAGAEHVRPLYELDPEDHARIREARERVELERRKSNANWDTALSTFTIAQSNFAHEYSLPAFEKKMVTTVFQGLLAGITPHFADERGYSAQYEAYKRVYDEACSRRNQGIGAMIASEAALATLRQEVDQRWLQQQPPITCAVAAVPGCRK